MPDLSFQVEKVEAVPFAASPTIGLKLRIANASEQETIHSALLRCQVRIEAMRRRYSGQEQDNLYELFGEPAQWGRSLRSLLWTDAQLTVPGFTDCISVDLPLPCTFDFTLAATRYFDGLEEGEAPLSLLFSGTVFYAVERGPLQVAQIPWDKEASCRLPAQVWRDLRDAYYPNSAWLCLSRDRFDRLRRYQRCAGLPTWEQALDRLLDQGEPAATAANVRSPS